MSQSGSLNRPLTTAVVACTWALGMGTTLQFILLPFVFPDLHAGDGLLRGGDWVNFHQAALDLAARIREHGWERWELRPSGQAPVGIAAALYASTGIHYPWVMLPLNAILFGLTASELHRLVQRITGVSWAWIGAIPFMVFPSSLLIYGQIHKDVFSISGLFITFNAILNVGQPLSRIAVAELGCRIVFGLGLIWLVRPYLVDIALLAFWLGVAGLLLGMLVCDSRKKIAGFVVMAALALGIQTGLVKTVERVQGEPVAMEQVLAEQAAPCIGKSGADRLACLLGAYRTHFIHHNREAGSLIDIAVELHNLSDVLEYSARALLVGFGAPFPSDWLAEGRTPGARIMRLTAGGEMLFAYMAYLGLAWGAWVLWMGRRVAELWAILVAAGAVVFIYALAMPAVGNLYRMRLGAWHTCIAIGCVFLVQMYLAATRGAKAKQSARGDRR